MIGVASHQSPGTMSTQKKPGRTWHPWRP
eukprot:gene6597-6825_t